MTLTWIDIVKHWEQETIIIGSDFKVFERKISESFWNDIKYLLDWDKNYFEEYRFDENRNIFHDWWNILIIEYTDKWLRDTDLLLNKKYFEKDRVHFSKELDWWLQVGELCWVIDYKWKYYIILDWLNKLTSSVDNIVFKWIIINPSSYFKDDLQETQKEVVWKVEEIMK